MKKNLYFLLMLAFFMATISHSKVLVFVHIGPNLPVYLEDCVWQAGLFNPSDELYVIASTQALSQAPQLKNMAHLVPIETLQPTRRHAEFVNSSLFKDFWLYASERFFYLDDFMHQYDIKDLFHIENDIVLYADLGKMLPIFHEQYKNIAATFDNDDRCIPGFIYIAHKEAMAGLADFFIKNNGSRLNDMQILALYKKQQSDQIGALPIMPPSYKDIHALVSPHRHTTQNPLEYSKNFNLFQSIFDAAAIGQYLGGIDPRNGPSNPGFINESCLFNPSLFTYEFKVDEAGRRVPHALFNGDWYRINNLHIHSKFLKPFLSRERV